MSVIFTAIVFTSIGVLALYMLGRRPYEFRWLVIAMILMTIRGSNLLGWWFCGAQGECLDRIEREEFDRLHDKYGKLK
jgi:hypothetical protein